MNKTEPIEQENEFPREMMFKIVFRNIPGIRESICSCLSENNLKYDLSEKNSSESKFRSYTITADFETEKLLDDVCFQLKSIEGFMMIF